MYATSRANGQQHPAGPPSMASPCVGTVTAGTGMEKLAAPGEQPHHPHQDEEPFHLLTAHVLYAFPELQDAETRLRAAAGRLLLVGVTAAPVDPLPDPAAADALPGPGVNLNGSLPASPAMPVSAVSSSAVSFPPGPLDVAPLLPPSSTFNTNGPVDLSGMPLANYVPGREKQQKPIPDSCGSGSGSVGVPPLATLLPHAQQLPFTGGARKPLPLPTAGHPEPVLNGNGGGVGASPLPVALPSTPQQLPFTGASGSAAPLPTALPDGGQHQDSRGGGGRLRGVRGGRGGPGSRGGRGGRGRPYRPLYSQEFAIPTSEADRAANGTGSLRDMAREYCAKE